MLALRRLTLTACAASARPEKKDADAAAYNTQLGIAYMQQGDLPLAKEKLDAP